MTPLSDILIGRVQQQQPGYTSVRVDRVTPLGNPFPVLGKLGKARWNERAQEGARLAYGEEEQWPPELRRAKAAGGFTGGETIRHYRAWLRAAYRAGGEARDFLEQLAERHARGERLLLGCHCAPLACHADEVARAILALARRPGRG